MKKYKKEVGYFGENIAKNFLIRNGYQIIGLNIKLGYPEIDIISYKKNAGCPKGETIFIEVKTRTSNQFGEADEALSSKQISTLKKAISIYCFNNHINMNFVRLDFIAIDLNRKKQTAKIKHYKNIF